MKSPKGADLSPERWRLVEDLFERALDTPADSRESFLASVCSDDAEVRTYVQALLAELEANTSFLEAPHPAAVLRVAGHRLSRLEPGEVLDGRFAILRLIGRGGMGQVYEALDRKLNEKVALKVLVPDLLADGSHVQRLRDEVRRARKVSHDNVCRVHEFFEVEREGGRSLAFFTMELLDGEPLSAILKRDGPFQPAQALDILGGIAAGIDAAHRKGVIHRDLKPGNVILVRDGERLRPKITDFGLAVGAGPDRTRQTVGGIAAGTPGYIAPEIATRGEVDTPADIYSLGVLARELVSAPGQKKAPQHWRAAVARATAHDPSKRHRSGAAFVRELSGVRRRLIAAGLLVTVAVALLFVQLWTQRAEPSSSIAVVPFENLTDDFEYQADGVTEDLIRELGRYKGFQVAGRHSSFQFRNKAAPARLIARDLQVRYLVVGTFRRQGERVHVHARLLDSEGNATGWSRTHEYTVAELPSVAPQIAADVAKAVLTARADVGVATLGRPGNARAYDALLRGRYYWNRRDPGDLRQAIRYFEEAVAADPGYAAAYASLADTLAALADSGAAPSAETLGKAKASALDALRLDANFGHAHASFALVTSLYDMDFATAERYFRRAIELDPNDGSAHQWYSALLFKLGRPEDCLVEAAEAVRCDNLSTAALFNQATMHYLTRRYERAVDLYLQVQKRAPSYWVVHHVLSEVYARLGQRDKALEHVRLALGQSRHQEHGYAYAAVAHAILGERAAAERHIDDLIRVQGGKPHQPIHIARAYAELGDVAKTLEWLQKAEAVRDHGVQIVAVHHSFDRVRNDPRLANFIRGLRITYPAQKQ